jgi:hypothetical protein
MSITKICVDVGRLLTDIGSSLYKNGGTILCELVQNAQRAKATVLRIAYCGNYTEGAVCLLEVSDNGRGLKKASDLLKLASSGWSKDVQDSDAPFGMGFWSTVTATSRVEVRSNNLHIVIDSDLLHRTKSVKGVVTTTVTEDFHPGFRVRLWSAPRPTDGVESRRWEAWTDLKKAVDRLEELVGFMDFESVEHTVAYGDGASEAATLEDLLEAQKEPGRLIPTRQPLAQIPAAIPFAKVIDNPWFEGVLWPQARSWCKADNAPVLGLRFYAQRRVVRELEYENVGGWLHLKPGVVNLRAPDRKDFVEDERYRSMMECFKAEARELLVDMVKQATDKELDEFDGPLRNLLSDSDVVDLLPYLFGIAPKEKPVGGQDESRGGVQPEQLPRQVEPEAGAAAAKEYRHEANQSAPVVVLTLTRARREAFELQLPAVWCEGADAERHKGPLSAAEAAGLNVIMTRTAMQRRALSVKSMTEPKLLHVKDMGGKVVTSAEVVAPEAPIGSVTVLYPALVKLAKAVGAEEVRVGHLTFRKALEVGGESFPLKVTEGSVILGMNVGQLIYVDASFAHGVLDKALDMADPGRYVFFRLLSTVAHERAHQLTPEPDGSVGHLSMIEDVMGIAHDWIAVNGG